MTRIGWGEFSATGMLWWVNRILHTFGFRIVVARDEDTDDVVDVYPARVECFGFLPADDEKHLAKFMGTTGRRMPIVETTTIEEDE